MVRTVLQEVPIQEHVGAQVIVATQRGRPRDGDPMPAEKNNPHANGLVAKID